MKTVPFLLRVKTKNRPLAKSKRAEIMRFSCFALQMQSENAIHYSSAFPFGFAKENGCIA